MTLMHEELDLNQAVDVFWFYFGYSGLFTLHDENAWRLRARRTVPAFCREASMAMRRDCTPP